MWFCSRQTDQAIQSHVVHLYINIQPQRTVEPVLRLLAGVPQHDRAPQAGRLRGGLLLCVHAFAFVCGLDRLVQGQWLTTMCVRRAHSNTPTQGRSCWMSLSITSRRSTGAAVVRRFFFIHNMGVIPTPSFPPHTHIKNHTHTHKLRRRRHQLGGRQEEIGRGQRQKVNFVVTEWDVVVW